MAVSANSAYFLEGFRLRASWKGLGVDVRQV